MASQERPSPHVKLAAEAIAAFVREGHVLAVPESIPPELAIRAGAFVCLKKDGMLRGCIGTIEPCCSTLAEEIIQNSISAATRDPRFHPVTPQELPALQVGVDVLREPELVDDVTELDARRYGVIVRSGHRRGLLLPDLEGVETPEQQIAIAMQKAGILPGEPVMLYRFEVERHE